MGVFGFEPIADRAAEALASRTALAALASACGVAQSTLPERDPHPSIFDSLDLVLSHLDDISLWPALYVRWELGVLAELGFGLEIEKCAMTGATEDLAFVSPNNGQGIVAGGRYALCGPPPHAPPPF